VQILALFAMECPVSLEAEDIRNEKVKLLRNIKPIALEDVVVGQYRGVTVPGQGYLPGAFPLFAHCSSRYNKFCFLIAPSNPANCYPARSTTDLFEAMQSSET
jgi:hypothetical protein